MSFELSQTANLAIRVRNVSKHYRLYERPQDRLLQMLWRSRRKFGQDFSALEGISFEVNKGETVGIIGRNGAGKSTLLQILAGTLTPSAGQIEVSGRIAPLIELGAGFNPEFTGRENVFFNGTLLGMDEHEVAEKYEAIVRFADIGEFIDQPVKTYSTGMQARLAFAVAIHVDPEILIVDEILAVGDAAFQRKCMKRFYQLRDSGCTILVVAHDQYLVRSLCHRALYLKRGRMVAFGPASDVVDLYHADLALDVADRDTARSAVAPPEPDAPCGDAAPAVGALDVLHSGANVSEPDKLFRIVDVKLLGPDGNIIDTVRCGSTVSLRMSFEALTDTVADGISFVFNLYTRDGLYVCGSTTLMDGLPPYAPGRQGEVIVEFPNLPLLQGRYVWRVAINDAGGMLVHAEAKGVCPFRVVDDFSSVGIVNLERRWHVRMEEACLA